MKIVSSGGGMYREFYLQLEEYNPMFDPFRAIRYVPLWANNYKLFEEGSGKGLLIFNL